MTKQIQYETFFPTINQKILKSQNINKKIKEDQYIYSIILKHRDIETNPRPMLKKLIKTLNQNQQKRYKHFFIPNTIHLKPKFNHISKNFTLLTQENHPLKPIHLTQLNTLCQTHNKYTPEQLIFAIITILSPNLNNCKEEINTKETQVTLILQKLQNTPQTTQSNTNKLQEFYDNNNEIITTPNTINKKLYEIICTTPNIKLQTLQEKFAYLATLLLTKAL